MQGSNNNLIIFYAFRSNPRASISPISKRIEHRREWNRMLNNWFMYFMKKERKKIIQAKICLNGLRILPLLY